MIRNKQKQTSLAKKQTKLSEQPSEQTFLEHIYELRTRLFWVVFALVVTSAAGFQYKDQLIAAVVAPLHGEKLIYLTPAGGFSFIFTLSIYFGVLVSIPVIMYQIYRFLRPLFGATSRKFIATLLFLSTLLAAAGAAFGYFVTIPGAINFLSDFAGDAVTPNLTAESYLNFVVAYVIGLAALFQLPLLLYMFDYARPIPPGMLLSTQRFVIIAATILAAIITPTPDAINMLTVAVPIIVVYEFGVVAVAIRHKIKSNKAKKSQVSITQEQPIDFLIPEVATELALQNERSLTMSVEGTKQDVHLNNLAQATPVRRTMDGVIKARRTSAGIVVPKRTPDPAVRTTPKIDNIRSIDGMVMSSPTTA